MPEFKDELETIKYAHRVRGISDGKNPLSKVWNSKRYIIPMMANAVRKGIRISMAMETRGFGKYNKRTNYKNQTIEKTDIWAFTVGTLLIISLVVFMYQNNLTDLGLIYV